MKKIPLSGKNGSGKFAIVDDDIFEKYGSLKWNLRKQSVSRNVCAGGKHETQILSRLILGITGNEFADHRDGNILDNRRENLRKASQQQNRVNSAVSKNNKSGYKGVYLSKPNKKWCASISHNRKQIHLGTFLTPKDAAIAYDKKAIELYGEFARPNFLDFTPAYK